MTVHTMAILITIAYQSLRICIETFGERVELCERSTPLIVYNPLDPPLIRGTFFVSPIKGRPQRGVVHNQDRVENCIVL